VTGAVKVRGAELLQKALNSFALNLDKAVDDAVRITAIKVNQTAITNIKTVSHGGKFVTRTKDGKTHEISAPGEAPNSDNGDLIRSVTFSHTKGSKIALVGTNLDYGAILETEKNRPWLEPAKESEEKSFVDNMKTAIELQVKKAGK